MPALDFKKQYKDLYLPGTEPGLVEVPKMTFIMVDGSGGPHSSDYAAAVEILYGLSYAIKMSAKGPDKPEGYIEYVVPPLEGLWWAPGDDTGESVTTLDVDGLAWVAMIRQPEFVTQSVYDWAVAATAKKKPGANYGLARLEEFEEGLCAQVMHVGGYDQETGTVARLDEFIAASGHRTDMGGLRQHHEIYLSDPRRTSPEKMKTVLRHPVAPA